MKVFDCGADGPAERAPGEGQNLYDRFKTMRRKETPSDLFIQVLKNVLDNRFAVVNNALPSGLSEPLPLILVGPTGLWMVLVSPLKGLFRASEGTGTDGRRTGVIARSK